MEHKSSELKAPLSAVTISQAFHLETIINYGTALTSGIHDPFESKYQPLNECNLSDLISEYYYCLFSLMNVHHN